MELKDRAGTFRATFGEEGAAKLGVRLKEKLKEYMDEPPDETLVKYVIVLLGNGRSKEGVKEELDVFLGDHSDDFVSWLWNHLESHLDQYIPSNKSSAVEVANADPEMAEHVDKSGSHQLISDSGGGKANKSSKSRHNRDWKGLVMDETQPPPLCSSMTDHVQNEEKSHRSALRSRQCVPPKPPGHRKRDRDHDQDRGRSDDRPRLSREVSATRRLLQFAVRDAVATTNPSNCVSEPSRKRLRSVVSTSTGISSEEVHPRKVQSLARLPNPMATAIKAVAEAAENVRVIRTGNVFDRLSRGADVTDVLVNNKHKFGEPVVEDDGYEDYENIDEKTHQRYLHTRGYAGGYNINSSMVDSSTGLASDSVSDNEGYGDVNVNVMDRREMNGIGTGSTRGYKVDHSYIMQSSVAQAQDTNKFMHQTRQKEEQVVSVANPKHKKIVNISVNVNTWKPAHYQSPREMVEVETRKSTQKTDIRAAGPSNVRIMRESSNSITGLGNGEPAAETPKESQKTAMPSAPGSYSAGRPLVNADSRTIFVNNVHFAATKDSLSRHFNKFGEVLKVIILTDAATGHSKGSAYVEFIQIEAAENALSLDGTSFMSRIIKVVKKSSGQQEASPTMTWPRMARGSPFGAPRFAQSPFPRGFSGAYRGIKPGARNMQWKRDQTISESISSPSGNLTNASTPPGSRGLTYIRTESNLKANPGGV